MKKLQLTILCSLFSVICFAQTLNVKLGSVVYKFPASQLGEMTYTDGTTVSIGGRAFTLADISKMYIDFSDVVDNEVSVVYDDDAATVSIAGNVANYVDATVSGAHVNISQSDELDATTGEITYSLSGSSSDGEFYLSGSYKTSVDLRGLTLQNTTPVSSGAAIHIQNGKRISLSVKSGTENTLTDAASGSQKGALYVKGHLELKGKGTLNVNGLKAHAIKTGEYLTLKNCTVNVKSAVKDGISCNEYFLQESGELTISGVGDDAIQADLDGTESTGQLTDHDGEDSGNVYLEGGTLTATVSADAAKGIKSAGDVIIKGGTLSITQTGGITVEDDDISYPTSVKADGNISITGGNITIRNTASGGKGLSAEGTISIDETSDTTVLDITANGTGGAAETSGGSGDDTSKSYKVYVSIPSSGGGQGGIGPGGQMGNSAWTSVYLYKSDGTLVQKLSSTVSRTSGNSTVTFYYYDFKAADSNTYYFKSDNYTSRGWGGSTTYTIVSETFSGPTDGTDVYYSITNSSTTSGTTRTYKLNNVTSTYGGTSDQSDEDGTAYNAAGLKADGDLTISGGTVTVANSGAMSKSIKSKGTVTIDGGTVKLTPSGAMMIISSDAGYSQGVKCKAFVMNDGDLTINASGTAGKGISSDGAVTTNGGTLTINATGAGKLSGSNRYTTKGIKADGNMALNDGTITVITTQAGAKAIKANGTYTQGTSSGSGPTLYVKTTGARLSSGSSSGGGFGGGMGKTTGSGGAAKGIKAVGTITIYGGNTEIYTSADGAEGLESKTSIYIQGGKHYLECYDDCINCDGCIYFNDGVTVCYSTSNDAVDSNYGRTGAITIGNGAVLAYSAAGGAEMGFDCDGNSYIQITGTGIALSAGSNQGGGSSGNSISNAKQGYYFSTSTLRYSANTYYTLADSSGKNLVTYSLPVAINSSCSMFTATGMVKGSTYTVKSSTTAPTDATTAFHGLYIGSSATGSTQLTSFTAQ